MKRFFLFFSDITALYAALFIVLLARYGSAYPGQFETHVVPFSIIFIFWIVIFYIANLYDLKAVRNNIASFATFFQAIAASGLISIALFYLVSSFLITPRTNLLLFIFTFTILATLLRAGFYQIVSRRFHDRVLLVGVNSQTAELVEFLNSNPQLGFEAVAVIDIDDHHQKELPLPALTVLNGIDHMGEIINRSRVDLVVVSPEAYKEPRLIEACYRLLNRVDFRNLASFYEQVTSRVPLGTINQIWFLENLSEGSKRGYEAAKRIFDFVFGIIGLVILTFIYPFVALAIRFDSPGPIFYRQKRVGQSGKIFEILKFRTMSQNAEQTSGAVWAKENDPRVTKVGNFLRRSRIDELPQVWNIIRGEMSFVGPRAERPEFHGSLKSAIPFYEERYIIKPGLSGWAQINYRYGASVDDTAQKLQYDLYYIKHRSLVLDVGIILKTINTALRQAGR